MAAYPGKATRGVASDYDMPPFAASLKPGTVAAMSDLTQTDLTGLLGLSSDTLLLLDRSGRVIHAAAPGRAPVGVRGLLTVKGGTLTARRKGEDKALRDALAGLSATEDATICFRNREGVAVMVIDLHLLPSGLVATRVADIVSRSAPSAARMRRVFGFTAAEARVAAAMLTGAGITEVAQRHRVEPETVRSQVKRIRSKTGARSVAELLLVLMATGSAAT